MVNINIKEDGRTRQVTINGTTIADLRRQVPSYASANIVKTVNGQAVPQQDNHELEFNGTYGTVKNAVNGAV